MKTQKKTNLLQKDGGEERWEEYSTSVLKLLRYQFITTWYMYMVAKMYMFYMYVYQTIAYSPSLSPWVVAADKVGTSLVSSVWLEASFTVTKN